MTGHLGRLRYVTHNRPYGGPAEESFSNLEMALFGKDCANCARCIRVFFCLSHGFFVTLDGSSCYFSEKLQICVSEVMWLDCDSFFMDTEASSIDSKILGNFEPLCNE